MNVLLWVLQSALALLCLSGGAYKACRPDELSRMMRALSPAAWRLLGVFELVCGILLIVPAVANWMPSLTPLAAVVLTVETLGLAGLYARRSLALTAANPLVWSAVMGVVAGIVAYGRYALVPLA